MLTIVAFRLLNMTYFSLGAVGTGIGMAAGGGIVAFLALSGVGEILVLTVAAGLFGYGMYWLGTNLTDILFKEMGW